MRFFITILLGTAYLHCPYFEPLSFLGLLIFVLINTFGSVFALLEDISNINN